MDSTAIKVDGISKTFKLPHEKQSSVKGVIINIYKGGKRSYENQQALKDVSLDIKQGDFYGIVGRNGSGKSTLLKLLAGIYSPDTGTIQINGKLTPFIELGVGFNPELTGRENVFLNSALLGFNRKEVRAMYDDIVAFAEIERFMDQKLKNYSSGMQVRLAFSIAIRARSDILLLDEVLAVGDAAFQQKCYNYFEELKEQNNTVVFVSHDMGAVRRFCNKAAYIENGEIVQKGSPFEIADVYVEENIENVKEGAKKEDTRLATVGHQVSVKLAQQTGDKVHLSISYKSTGKDEVYVGMSVIRDGVSVAEINTLGKLKLKDAGKITYDLDTSVFNAGVYYVSIALFRMKNKALIAVGKNRAEFVLKGDKEELETKGAAVKLAEAWDYAGAK